MVYVDYFFISVFKIKSSGFFFQPVKILFESLFNFPIVLALCLSILVKGGSNGWKSLTLSLQSLIFIEQAMVDTISF